MNAKNKTEEIFNEFDADKLFIISRKTLFNLNGESNPFILDQYAETTPFGFKYQARLKSLSCCTF